METPDFLQPAKSQIEQTTKSFFGEKKKWLSVISLIVLVLGIPLAVWLLQRAQIFAPKAEVKPIELVTGGDSCVISTDPNKVTCASFPIKLTSPLGPPVGTGASCNVDSDCQSGDKCFKYQDYPGSCKPSDTICAQVVTRACEDVPQGQGRLSRCADFPTSCHVPPGWIIEGPHRSPSPTASASASIARSPSPSPPSAPSTTPPAFSCVNQNQVGSYVFHLIWPQTETGITSAQVSADAVFSNPYVSTTFVQSGTNMLAKGPGNFSNNFQTAFRVDTTYYARLMRGNTPGTVATLRVPSCPPEDDYFNDPNNNDSGNEGSNGLLPLPNNFAGILSKLVKGYGMPGFPIARAQMDLCSNLIENFSFEQPQVINPATNNSWIDYGAAANSSSATTANIPGWDPRAANASYQVEIQKLLFGPAADGSQYAEIDIPGIISLTQPLPTQSGQQYQIKFSYSPRPDLSANQIQKLGVYWNGQQVGAVDGTQHGAGTNWQEKTFTVAGIEGTSKLGIGALTDSTAGGGNLIDNVSVTQISGQCDPDASPSASPSPEASGSGTLYYKVAESEAGLAEAQITPYTEQPTITDFTFSDPTPGTKQIWVEFIGLDTGSRKEHISVDLVEPEPEIASLDCSVDIAKKDLKITLTGSRLGNGSGKITANGKDSQILTWSGSEVTATIKPEGSLEDGKLFKVLLTRADGRVLPEATCLVNTTVLSLGARLFCREPGKFDVSGVKVTLVDENGNKVNEEVTIDKDGLIKGLKTKLQVGKLYAISVKAPNSLRRNAQFTAANGTNVITQAEEANFILPVGDISPVILPDGKINTLDRSEIVRQWSVLGAGSNKTGDFNRDTKVNSIDWACMRYDFNKEDDSVPSQVAASPSPTSSPIASAVVPSPSPSASSSPTQRAAYFLLGPEGDGTYSLNKEFSFDVNIWSQNEAANLFKASLKFDPSSLEVVRIEKSASLTNWIEDFYNNSTGDVSLVAGLPNPGLKTTEDTNNLMARIIFRGKKPGSTSINITESSQIFANSDNANILGIPLSTQQIEIKQ